MTPESPLGGISLRANTLPHSLIARASFADNPTHSIVARRSFSPHGSLAIAFIRPWAQLPGFLSRAHLPRAFPARPIPHVAIHPIDRLGCLVGTRPMGGTSRPSAGGATRMGAGQAVGERVDGWRGCGGRCAAGSSARSRGSECSGGEAVEEGGAKGEQRGHGMKKGGQD